LYSTVFFSVIKLEDTLGRGFWGRKTHIKSRDSSVGVATGLTVRGSNLGGGGEFSAPVHTGCGAHLASCIREDTASGAWHWTPTAVLRGGWSKS